MTTDSVKVLSIFPPSKLLLQVPRLTLDFQAWPYPSATRMVVNDLKNETLVTGDRTFLDTLDPEFVVDDLVNYDFVKKSLMANPTWKDDPSVPKSDNPFEREEILEI